MIYRMGKKKRNYSRFYALCKAKGIDLEQYKDDLISQFTQGRTTSLKDMKDSEYDEMCDCIQSGRHQSESRDDYVFRPWHLPIRIFIDLHKNTSLTWQLIRFSGDIYRKSPHYRSSLHHLSFWLSQDCLQLRNQ